MTSPSLESTVKRPASVPDIEKVIVSDRSTSVAFPS